MNYNLNDRCMHEVHVTDDRTAESAKVFAIEPEALYIADAGFGTGKNLQHVTKAQADALFRVTPNRLCLAEDSEGKIRFNMVEKLNTKAETLDFTCFVHTENGSFMPIRIIASRLPKDKALLAQNRKKRNAQKHQSKIRPQTLVYAKWVILATTLASNHNAEDLLKLYRSRWQIELLFKRIKQFFSITKLRAATLEHSKALVLLWLIQWSVIERQTIAMEQFLIAKGMKVEFSNLWSIQNFIFHFHKTFFNLSWASPLFTDFFAPLLS